MCEFLGGKPMSVMKVNAGGIRKVHHRPVPQSVVGSEYEHICWDPKDGELCPNRAKPEETLVEVRSGPDVQIGRPTWV